MILNEQQEKIVQDAIYFLFNSSDQVFEYDGGAGTGKSVVMHEIFKRSGYRMDQILPMAFTGQAAIVMRTKGFYNAKTIHSTLYHLEKEEKKDNNGNIIYNKEYNIPEISMNFVPKDDLGDKRIMFIDEGYMVPKYMKKDIEKHHIKIIVSGDKGQLPPISDSPAYLYRDDMPHLTQLMRQEKDSPITYLAYKARNGKSIDCGLYGNTALVIDEWDMNDEMLQKANIVLCATNNTRDKLNKHIRGNIHNIHSTIPVYGDRVICRKNNWDIELDGISLANGLVGNVTSFYNAATNINNGLYKMDFKPDLLDNSFINIKCDYKYLLSNPKEKQLIKNSKYSYGEKFEYAYCLTTHLAQGSEYDHGIYIEEPFNPQIQNNLNYTGITRFKKSLIYIKKHKKYY